MSEQILSISQETQQQLDDLRLEPKFHEEGFYPGAYNEEIRQRAENAVNIMLDRLQLELPRFPQKSYMISEFLEMLKAFEDDDNEEREQACAYCERVMDILSIESSDGALNTWLYGFDPAQN